jgi:hypothetical protein
MGEYLVKFVDTRSVSNNKLDFHQMIPLMLRPQQCWKYPSFRKNIVTSWLRKLGYQIAGFGY